MKQETLPPVIGAVRSSLQNMSKQETDVHPRLGMVLDTVLEESIDFNFIPSSEKQSKRKERSCSPGTSTEIATGRERTAEVIERVIKSAEKRAAELHAMTTIKREENVDDAAEQPSLVQQYIMPVIDFVTPKSK